MPWTVETLNVVVGREIQALPADMRAYLQRIVGLIESFGLEHVHEPYIKHVQGRLWEMRLKGRAGIARAIYVTSVGQRVVIVRAFVKKTQKTPRSELELALRRAKEV
jgi:phage-related protein